MEIEYDKYKCCIIPKKYSSNRINIERLAKRPNCCIVRRSNKSTVEETFNLEFETLRSDAINWKETPVLSMNILGGKFNVNHLKYISKGHAMNSWSSPESLSLNKYRGKSLYGRLRLGIPIYFYLIQIHNKPFPYYRYKDKDVDKLIESLGLTPDKETDEKGTRYTLSGVGYVKHTPNKLNYWHVEYDLKGIENKEVGQPKGFWKESAARFAFEQIISVAAQRKICKYLLIS